MPLYEADSTLMKGVWLRLTTALMLGAAAAGPEDLAKAKQNLREAVDGFPDPYPVVGSGPPARRAMAEMAGENLVEAFRELGGVLAGVGEPGPE